MRLLIAGLFPSFVFVLGFTLLFVRAGGQDYKN